MRTAEEILLEIYNPSPHNYNDWREDLQLAITLNPSIELIEQAINKAREEAIKEAAKVASVQFHNYDKDGNIINVRGMGYEVSIDGTRTTDYISVDKQSILNLLNEIK